MLQQVTHIEGLKSFADIEMQNDTDPSATLITFEVREEEMPALTAQKGEVVRQNFVWIEKVINLGNLIIKRRINDSVEYDKVEHKWKVLKLYSPQSESDIMRYPNEWNAFARGTVDEVVGSPLSLLFKSDPAKVTTYKAKYISTIEQLAALTDANLEGLGLGGRSDRDAAQRYVSKIASQAPAREMNARLESLEAEIARKNKEMEALSAQLAVAMNTVNEAPLKKKAVMPRAKSPIVNDLELLPEEEVNLTPEDINANL
jgi:uncharacterized coiled-coil protein SlyX